MTFTIAPVVSTESVPALQVLGEEMRPLLHGGAFEVVDVRGPRETGPPPHNHPWDEGYLVLEGELEVLRAEESFILAAGDCIQIPAMTLHSYRVASEVAHFLTITSPASAVAFFTDVAANAPTLENLPAVIEVARRNRVDSPLFSV